MASVCAARFGRLRPILRRFSGRRRPIFIFPIDTASVTALTPLGFWKALDEVFPGTRHQRCWVHKTANVLNKVTLSVAA